MCKGCQCTHVQSISTWILYALCPGETTLEDFEHFECDPLMDVALALEHLGQQLEITKPWNLNLLLQSSVGSCRAACAYASPLCNA